MRSIPQAMTWEMLSHGKWSLLAAALGANVFPVILFVALRNQGTIEPDDPSLIIMHVVLMQLIMFIFGSAVFSAQGHPSRLFAFPISTATLVTWHLLPAMLLMILESLASTAAMNALFDLRWPLWGPAFFLAVAWSAVVAVFWLTEKSGWLLPLMTLIAGGLGLWFKSRYGNAFSLPSRYWTEVTPADAAIMTAIGSLSFFAAVIGVSRNRRGEPLASLEIMAWLERVFDPALDSGRRFASPEQAQLWFEWRQKGWAMPVAVGFPLVIVCGIAFIFDRNWQSIWEGFVTGGMLLSVVGIVGGIVLGNVSMHGSRLEMGHFLATRPMTNSNLAGAILKAAVKSTLMAWSLWAVAFVSLDLSFQAWEIVPAPTIRLQLRWWYLPATLLGCWTVVGLVTSVCLTGRLWFYLSIYFGLIAGFLGLALFPNVLTPFGRENFSLVLMCVSGIAFVLVTGWAIAAAHRRALIRSSVAWMAFAIWGSLSALAVLDALLVPTRSIAASVFAVGLLALTVSPLATAPLALAWNRTR